MELLQAMRTVGSCRYFKPDPVPIATLYDAFEHARFAGQGGNRQPLRWVVVTDKDKKQRLQELYLPPWQGYLEKARSGEQRTDGGNKMLESADYFANHLAEVPAIVVPCARLEDLFASDKDLGRLSIVGGASVYPTVQNFILACRASGVATALTTLLCLSEPEVVELLEIPEGFATAAHIAVGFPVKPFPRKLNRLPVTETVFVNRFGDPIEAPAAAS